MSKPTEYYYKGLVLAALEITPSNPQHGDEVEFADSSSGGRAVFLMKVKEYEKGKFKATYVSPERAARHVELFPKLNKTNISKHLRYLWCMASTQSPRIT